MSDNKKGPVAEYCDRAHGDLAVPNRRNLHDDSERSDDSQTAVGSAAAGVLEAPFVGGDVDLVGERGRSEHLRFSGLLEAVASGCRRIMAFRAVSLRATKFACRHWDSPNWNSHKLRYLMSRLYITHRKPRGSLLRRTSHTNLRTIYHTHYFAQLFFKGLWITDFFYFISRYSEIILWTSSAPLVSISFKRNSLAPSQPFT